MTMSPVNVSPANASLTKSSAINVADNNAANEATHNSIRAAFNLARDGFLLDVDFTAPSHGVTALFGMSGSGKTTILRCIAGLESPDHGMFQIGDDSWQNASYSRPVHQRSVGYVFQEANLFNHLNIENNLRYGLKRIPRSMRKIDFNDAVQLLGLSQLLSRKPTQLSGGQRQRAAIARALLSSPRLLLMDEPLASLDLQSKAEILPYLEQLHSQLRIPIIYVSHSPEEVVRIADHLVLLEHGKVKAQGAVNELMTRTDLPLAHLDEACAVIEGVIDQHEPEYHLSYISIAGGRVAVSQLTKSVGERVRVRIAAKDVSLARLPGQQSSITNVFPVRVKRVSATHDPAKVIVKLDTGGDNLLAQITARSAAMLAICSDQIVYAQVKSVALMR